MAMNETGIEVSLAAEIDGMFVGFLIARVYYGDFGIAEPAAVLEVIGVHPDFRGRGVGHALLHQLTANLLGLGVGVVSTEVSWDDQRVMAFMHREGFLPAPRFCLDLDCEAFRRRRKRADTDVNLNKSTRYALHAALEMALWDGQPVTVSQIADRYEIPENVVAKVLQQLARAGIARGVRGVGGGYRLARVPSEVAVQDIIDIFEPAPPPDTCMLREVPRASCPGEEQARCRLMDLFQEVDETVRATFASVSLATLASS